MSAPLRFLGLVVIAWGAVRIATLDSLPGTAAMPAAQAQSAAPPIVPTEFPPIAPLEAVAPAVQPMPPGFAPMAMAPAGAAYAYYYPPYPSYAPPPMRPAAAAIAPRRGPLTDIVPVPAAQFYAPIPPLDDWPIGRIASGAGPIQRSTPAPAASAAPSVPPKLDRLQLASWALLRDRSIGGNSLASGGTLGGSQAGARLTYNVNRSLAASFRATSPVNGPSGTELAAGVRYRPLRSLPVWVTAERRQAIGAYGRSAFALFAEGGVYGRPMPWRFELDAYAQGGVVGINSRDLFVDGGFTLARPLFGQYSAGFGVWGGAQPGLYRVDAGPRVSMRVRGNMRVHLDWRQRLAGSAAPGSGPAVTLAADF